MLDKNFSGIPLEHQQIAHGVRRPITESSSARVAPFILWKACQRKKEVVIAFFFARRTARGSTFVIHQKKRKKGVFFFFFSLEAYFLSIDSQTIAPWRGIRLFLNDLRPQVAWKGVIRGGANASRECGLRKLLENYGTYVRWGWLLHSLNKKSDQNGPVTIDTAFRVSYTLQIVLIFKIFSDFDSNGLCWTLTKITKTTKELHRLCIYEDSQLK